TPLHTPLDGVHDRLGLECRALGETGQVEMQAAVLVRGQALLLLLEVALISPRAARWVGAILGRERREGRVGREVHRVPAKEHSWICARTAYFAEVEERNARPVVYARIARDPLLSVEPRRVGLADRHCPQHGWTSGA